MDPKVIETAGLFGAFVLLARITGDLVKFAITKAQVAKTINGHGAEFEAAHPEAVRINVQLKILDELRIQSSKLDSVAGALGAHDHRAVEFIGTANAALITQAAMTKELAGTNATIAAVLPGIERALRETK